MNRRNSWLVIFIFSVVLVAGSWEAFFRTASPLLEETQFYDTVYQLDYKAYYDNVEDKYYLFLPSYVTLDNISVSLPVGAKVSYSCDGIDHGNEFNSLSLGEDIEVTLRTALQTEKYILQIQQCENLSTIYIETESGNLDSVNSSKDNNENVAAILVNVDGSIEYSGSGEISGRGNSTFGVPKNSYNLNFINDISAWKFDGVNKLCLLANYYDESSLRNLIGYTTAKEKGIDYTSSYQMVNLYANGEYLGLYGVTTKQEYEKYIEEDNITAAFSFAYEEEEENTFSTINGTYIEVLYGDINYVKTIVNAFEDALDEGDYDTVYQYIDIDSFAEKYAFEEYFANSDISWMSQYFYIDYRGKINYMCAWDYDNILGSRSVQQYDSLVKIKIQSYRSKYSLFAITENSWWRYLLEDECFRLRVVRLLETEYNDFFYEELFEQIYGWIDEINVSWKCDRIRWDSELKYDGFGYESLMEYVLMYEDVICDRSDLLISYLTEPESYCIVEFVNMHGGDTPNYSNICIPYGSRLSDYTENYSIVEYETLGLALWRTEDGRSLGDIDIVTEDIVFYNEIDLVTENLTFNNEIDSVTEDSDFYELIIENITFHRLVIFGACGMFGLILLVMIVTWAKRNICADGK